MADEDWSELLFRSTQAMFAEGRPLMQRVLPSDASAEIWRHYPEGDVVSRKAGSRYFYHCHPPGERIAGEHGHFHLFLAKSAMPKKARPLRSPATISPPEPRADVVHLAALAISAEGLPLAWFATNRWVTDEWLYPAREVSRQLERFDLRGSDGDALVTEWLTAMVAVSRDLLGELLEERDAALARDPGGEDRTLEVASSRSISLERLFAA